MRTRILLLAALLLLSGTNAFADIPPKPRPIPPPNPNPAPVQSKEANLIVEVDPNAKEARLIIPRSIVIRKAGLDADDGTRLAEADGPNSRHIIIAGIALSFAACGSGIWLVRKNRLSSMGLVLFLVVGAGLVVGAMAWANARAPSPPPPPPAPQPAANLLKIFDGKIKVETPAEGDTIRFIVNEDMLARIVKENLKREAPLVNPAAPTPPRPE
jgi:hypothetical protein